MSNADYLAAMAEAKLEYERYLEASKRKRPNTRVDSRRTPPAAAIPAKLPDVSDVGDVPAALEVLDAADEAAKKLAKKLAKPVSQDGAAKSIRKKSAPSSPRKAAARASGDGTQPKKSRKSTPAEGKSEVSDEAVKSAPARKAARTRDG